MRALRVGLVAVALAVVAGAAAVYAFVGWEGLRADRPPGSVETAIARRLLWLSIPAADRGLRNPIAADPNSWRTGSDRFAESCARCHGLDGRGRTDIGPRMYPPVPDLASDAVQRLSDGALFSIIQHGVRWTGMPAFSSSHGPEDTWRLVAFVRRVPRLTPADLHTSGPRTHHPSTSGTTVRIEGTAFEPRDITVSVGQTIVWLNEDPFPHNVSSASGGFHSGDLQPEAHWTFQPTTRGTFPYVCTLHPGMKGTVRVQ
jgi:plastocyanin/mono/diheme cytochrome c family protein